MTKKKALKATFLLILLLAGAMLGARMYLPYWATDYVNRQIAALDGYSGSIDDLDISLYRGAYQIHGLDIHKTRGGLKKPFVAAETVELSIEWKALFEGRIVAEIDMENINLTFTPSQTGAGGDWGNFIDSLSPFDINRLSVSGGRVAYLDYRESPDVNIYISGINGSVTNLRNVEDKNTSLPSDLEVFGTSIGKGKVSLTGKVNIMKNMPDFDLNMKLENAALTSLNTYTRAAAGVDFEKGRASIYSELASSKNRVTGYIKILAFDVALIGSEDNPINAVWESLVSAFMTIFKNHSQDQFAFRIPIEGSLENLEGNGWAAFVSVFKNAFGKAFPRNTDGNINFMDALRQGSDPS